MRKAGPSSGSRSAGAADARGRLVIPGPSLAWSLPSRPRSCPSARSTEAASRRCRRCGAARPSVTISGAWATALATGPSTFCPLPDPDARPRRAPPRWGGCMATCGEDGAARSSEAVAAAAPSGRETGWMSAAAEARTGTSGCDLRPDSCAGVARFRPCFLGSAPVGTLGTGSDPALPGLVLAAAAAGFLRRRPTGGAPAASTGSPGTVGSGTSTSGARGAGSR
jgi:hypothetical protein